MMLASRLAADPGWVRDDRLGRILKAYHRERMRKFAGKSIISAGFQKIIRHANVCNLMQKYLAARQHRADSFIGMVGNVYKPLSGLLHMLRA